MSTKRSVAILVAFVVLCLGGGMAIGISNPPGEWYRSLAKPVFTPPNWLFPVAWSLLYVLVAIAGWRVFVAGPRGAQVVWVLQLALNFVWSPVFFGAHRIGLGLTVVALLLVTVLAFVALTLRANRAACFCFLPYAGWVALATALNLSIWRLN